MPNAKPVGGAPLLLVLCIGTVVTVFSCSGDHAPAEKSMSTKPSVDLTKAVRTGSSAVVCSQANLLLAAARPDRDPLDRIYGALNAILAKSEKVKAAGCQEWKAGIPLYNVKPLERLDPSFIGFGLTPDETPEYFTTRANLTN
jgi:hypothetical protein